MKTKSVIAAFLVLCMLASLAVASQEQLLTGNISLYLQAVPDDPQPMDSPHIAHSPKPEDGSQVPSTWTTLQWIPGDTAVWHDVYFSGDYDAVANGTNDAFQSKQTKKYFVLGFAPYPYPEGLVPGSTYYWRIDEVEADGVTKHTGSVWSFSVPPNKAYDPSPTDGMTDVPTDVTLTWTRGFNAIVHRVCFSDDYDTVADAPINSGQETSDSSYTPQSPLANNKTYYWRVDESNMQTQEYYKGDVWSFTTVSTLLTYLEITGPDEVFEVASAQYNAIAYYEGGSTKNVTDSANWWLEETSYATVNGNGLLTCKKLDAPVAVVLHAEYTENDVTVEDTQLISCVPIHKIYYIDVQAGNDNYDGLSPDQAFETIQKGIDTTEDGDVVLVFPGIYQEEINFQGKAIMVKSAEDAAILEAPDAFAVSFYMNEEPSSILKNFVIRNSYMGVFVAHSSPSIVNVTIVNNRFGMEAYAGSYPNISNCIFWDNMEGDLFGSQASYSCINDPDLHINSFHAYPLFVDHNGGDYHLRSERGRYWPENDIWVLDSVTSPCIDAGDPNMVLSDELIPNGGRINIGAYGGTPYASMNEMQTNPRDINRDGWVNMLDLAALAEGWLLYDPPAPNKFSASVIVAAPSDGAIFNCSIKSVNIEAYAYDPDEGIVEVRFYANGRYYANDIDGRDGWKVILTNFSASYYEIRAEAVDKYGASITSQSIDITVCGPRN